MSQHHSSNKELNQKIQNAVNKFANLVICTLGPKGKNVVLGKSGQLPYMTKDGVSIAKHIKFQDPFENAIASIIRQAAEQTGNAAGDGTTTSTLLAQTIYNEAQNNLNAGMPPIDLCSGIDLAIDEVLQSIEKNKKQINTFEEVYQVALISSNGDQTIAKIIADCVEKIGTNGHIAIREGKSYKTEVSYVDGFHLETGWCSDQFATNEARLVASLANAFVLVSDQKIHTHEQIAIASTYAVRGNRPLIVIADSIEGEALNTMIYLQTAKKLSCVALKAPLWGWDRKNTLSDLALSVGATFFSVESGKNLLNLKLEDLGQVDVFEGSRHHALFSGGHGKTDAIAQRIEALEEDISKSQDDAECEKLALRLRRLSSGTAVIHVGGNTPVEAKERKDRLEDALEAVKSGREEGIVPGGGSSLIHAGKTLNRKTFSSPAQEAGYKIIKNILKSPLKQICKNADLTFNDIYGKVEKSRNNNFGYNLVSGKFGDLFEMGVIDPYKVVKNSLLNGSSVAKALLMTESAVIDE